jgi:hypothetical protein
MQKIISKCYCYKMKINASSKSLIIRKIFFNNKEHSCRKLFKNEKSISKNWITMLKINLVINKLCRLKKIGKSKRI